MATYLELFGIRNDSELVNRVTVAAVIAATAIKDESTPPESRLEWARATLAAPGPAARQVLNSVLAQNKDSTVEQITEATDVVLQAAVDAVVDLLAGT